MSLIVPASALADGLDRALASGELTEAEYALERASALFDRAAVSARYGATDRPDAHDATLVLRNLRAALPSLRGGDREAARAILARPSAGEDDPFGLGYDRHVARKACGEHVCVHWTETGPDAPSLADADGSGLPDWVEATDRVFHQVWAKQVDELGYRAPLDDSESGLNGGDGRFDVYLSDIGDDGYFGYCTTDDPNADRTPQVSAYCVVENDFLEPAFGGMAPVKALRATAAHEFFHAVQFAYDWFEDTWFMEGTATWIEDEVFDSVDDNRRFLEGSSPLARPDVPLDHGDGGFEYGGWIFWRYLSERYGPGIVRDVWERAEPAQGGDRYSLEAVAQALAARRSSFRSAFAGFGAANRAPAASYSEGSAYVRAATWRRHLVSADARSAAGETTLAHLAARTVSFHPGTGIRGSARLRLSVGASRANGSATARAVVVYASGRVKVRKVGIGSVVSVPFGRAQVRRVDLVLANAGADFVCWRGTALSCRGLALDDGLRLGYSATLR